MKDDNNKIIVEEDKPTKECKHEELLGDDYTEDCSVKLFGYRDKKGVTHITREEVSSPKIDSLLKEADKEYDKIWSELGYKKSIPEFYHSQISKAYEAGQEEGRKNLLDECPDTQFLIGKAIAEERERIIKLIDKLNVGEFEYTGYILADYLLEEIQNNK